MAETAADVRRDIEITRERMSDTIAQLEQKLNLMQIVKDHPWPAIGAAVAAGLLLSGSRADVKAAAASLAATEGASNKLGAVLDDLVAGLVTGVSAAFHGKVDSLVDELKAAIGVPAGTASRAPDTNVGIAGTTPATHGLPNASAQATPWPTPSKFGGHQPGLTGEAAGSGLGNQIAGQEAPAGAVEWQKRAD